MTAPMCSKKWYDDGGRLKICRRAHEHTGPCIPSTARARARPNLEFVVEGSAAMPSLPSGDYTDQVKQVYIRGRTVTIQFTTSVVEVLIERRRHA